jgi:hypothetical protein
LALFGRRPPQRVDSLLMPASENLHRLGSVGVVWSSLVCLDERTCPLLVV